MSRKGSETELLLVSEAVARLEGGMYGNIAQAEPIAKIKEEYKKRRQKRPSIGWGPLKEEAAKFICEAAVQGELSVFVLPHSPACTVPETALQVPPDVLQKMMRTRGGLPDHAIQPMRMSFPKTTITTELRVALSKSALYVRCKEFEAWYKKERNKQGWPSQRPHDRSPTSARSRSRKNPVGRPSKQSSLRTSICALVGAKRWSAQQKIADLVRLLESKGITAARDTASRTVDQIFKETGQEAYRRRARRRSAVKSDNSKQINSDI